MTYYAVARIEKTQQVKIKAIGEDVVQTISLSWADGMIGCMAVFDNKKDALKYANGKSDIAEFESIP